MENFNPQGPRRPRPCRINTGCSLRHFNPQGPRRPRPLQPKAFYTLNYFNPQGPRRPRPAQDARAIEDVTFQSPGPSQAPTFIQSILHIHQNHFNPQGPRRPRRREDSILLVIDISIPRALAGPDNRGGSVQTAAKRFQSPGPSQAPTPYLFFILFPSKYFNPQGPRRPRRWGRWRDRRRPEYFNPQGPRRPRRHSTLFCKLI